MSPSHQERAREALAAIAYSEDPSIPVGARTAALGELSRMPLPADAADQLTADEVRAEMESLRDALGGWFAVMDGPDSVEPPDDLDELRETLAIALQVNALLEHRCALLEAALQHERRHRLLPAAPEPIA